VASPPDHFAAAARERSGHVVGMAFTAGSTSFIRDREASTSSAGETCLLRSISTTSWAGLAQSALPLKIGESVIVRESCCRLIDAG